MNIESLMEARSKQIMSNEQLKSRVLGATMPETRGLLQYPKEMYQSSSLFD